MIPISILNLFHFTHLSSFWPYWFPWVNLAQHMPGLLMNCKLLWRGKSSGILCLPNSTNSKCSVCPHPHSSRGCTGPWFCSVQASPAAWRAGSQRHCGRALVPPGHAGSVQAAMTRCEGHPAGAGFERASRHILEELCWFRAAGDQPDFAKRGQINGLNFAWLFLWTQQWITPMVFVLFSDPAEAPSHPGH